MSNKAISVYAEALKRKQEEKKDHQIPRKATSTITRKPTRVRDVSRGIVRDLSRGIVRDPSLDNSRGKSRDLPTRDEIQEFSFRLRDELKVKVQAEVPYQWQKELDEIARDLDVKKLELYRFIIGKFLGKVEWKKAT